MSKEKAAAPAAAKVETVAAAAPAPLTAPIPRHLVGLAFDRWALKEHRNPGNWVCVPVGTAVEDLLEPSFWANVARQLKPNSTIEVHWDDSSRYAELYVISAGRNWAAVTPMRVLELAKPKLPDQADKHRVEFAGPVDKHRVVRITDGAVLRAGFATEREAQTFLDGYLRSVAA